MTWLKKVVIVVPTFNNANTIQAVLQDIRSNTGVQIVVVDGGSSDGTVEKAKGFGVDVIPLSPEIASGYSDTVTAGIHAMKWAADAIIIFDGDGMYAASSIPRMISCAIDDNADVVFGYAKINRKLTDRVCRRIVKYLYARRGIYVEDIICTLRLFRCSIIPNTSTVRLSATETRISSCEVTQNFAPHTPLTQMLKMIWQIIKNVT